MVICILLAVVLFVVGLFIPSVSLPLWGFALCFLAWGLKDEIPYWVNSDSDYAERYFKAQEDAQLYTKAMLHQAHLHKGEIRILNDMINKEK